MDSVILPLGGTKVKILKPYILYKYIYSGFKKRILSFERRIMKSFIHKWKKAIKHNLFKLNTLRDFFAAYLANLVRPDGGLH